ncbi:class I SAM-dependent methyltransferase [Salinithrix halophila]|uniref:Class I SAM-dependent methyltransferase n=1 Tax=Salinithrix halophila TaxID=1485204 RepID=A0ABV8JG78_9BACL
MKQFLAESRIFFSRFIHSPDRIGSILPSSPFLVHAMLRQVDWSRTRTLVELGAGTGAVTRRLDSYLYPGSQVAVFEQDKILREHLCLAYPHFQHFSQAEDLCSLTRLWGVEHVDCVVSSLPFTVFPEALRNRILQGIQDCLRPGGLFITYQYSLHMKKRFTEQFELLGIRFVPLNIPCAFVYVCRKR